MVTKRFVESFMFYSLFGVYSVFILEILPPEWNICATT